jgi:hypothetical protein
MPCRTYSGLFASAALACSASVNEPPPQDAAGAPVIVHLQSRGGELTVTSSAGGVRYGVRDRAGNTFAQLTLEELERSYPELSQMARSAVAAAPGAGIFPAGAEGMAVGACCLDARVEPSSASGSEALQGGRNVPNPLSIPR